MILVPSLAGLLLIAAGQSPAVAPAPAAERYTVTLELRRGTEVIGRPSVTVADGSDATVTVARAYQVRLRANKLVAETGQPPRVLVTAEVAFPAGRGWGEPAAGQSLATLGQTRPLELRRRSQPQGAGETASVTVARAAVTPPPARPSRGAR